MRKSLSLVALSFVAASAVAAPSPNLASSASRSLEPTAPALMERYDQPAGKALPADVTQTEGATKAEKATPQEQVAWRFLRRFLRA